MLPDYNYQCKDDSILLNPFKKRIVSPLMRFVPWGLPANIITIVANLFLYAALFLVVQYPVTEKWLFIAIPVLIFAYVLGDHFDGMQAKRTGTGSQLGEFHDHYLDVFNNGIISFLVLTLYGITNPLIYGLVFFTSYLAHSTIIYEEYKTKWLVFEKFGSLEANFVIMLVILLGYFQPLFVFLNQSVFGWFRLIEIFFILSAIGTIGTGIKSLMRTKKITYQYLLFFIAMLSMVVLAYFNLKLSSVFLIFTLYNGDYMGNLIRGHLADGKERLPDLLVPSLIIIYSFFPLLNNPFSSCYILYAIYIYLGCRILWIIVKTFSALKQFWVWTNSPKK